MTKAHHGFWHRNSIRAVLLVPALAGISLSQANASTYPNATALGIWRAALSGPTTKISGSSTGATIAMRGDGLPVGNGWMPAGNYGVAPGTQGGVRVGGAGTVSVGGKSVPVDISGSLSKEVIAGAISGCLSGSIAGCVLGTATPLAIAWMTSSGTRINPTTGGAEGTGGEEAGSCSASVCYYYEYRANLYRSLEAACKAHEAFMRSIRPTWTVNWGAGVGDSCNGSNVLPNGEVDLQGPANVGVVRTLETFHNSSTWNPITPANVLAALIKAGAPPPMIVPELEKAGVDWNKRWPGFDTGAGTPDGGMGAPNLFGPATIKGDTTTTTNGDGSRTTTTTSTPITYGPGTATAGPGSSTTTTTNADGTIRNTSTTTTTPGEGTPSGEEEKPPVDPCDEHPDRVGCLDIDVPEGQIPKETKNVTFTPSELPGIGAGQCPADVSMSFTAAPIIGAATIINWRSFCDMALPLRAIVMALASIMAFFIVMPGGRVE